MSSAEGGDGDKEASSGLLKMMEGVCPLLEELNRETAVRSTKGSTGRLR